MISCGAPALAICAALHLCRLKITVANAGGHVASAPMQSEGNSVKALITEIRKEEVKVHIDIDARIKARCFLSTCCTARSFEHANRQCPWTACQRLVSLSVKPQISLRPSGQEL